jgi:hypothetical protein
VQYSASSEPSCMKGWAMGGRSSHFFTHKLQLKFSPCLLGERASWHSYLLAPSRSLPYSGYLARNCERRSSSAKDIIYNTPLAYPQFLSTPNRDLSAKTVRCDRTTI